MKKSAALLLAFVMAFSLCACETNSKNKEREEYAGKVSELISDTAWGGIIDEIGGEYLMHGVLFSEGEDGYGDIEYFIQVGDETGFQVRGRYIVSTQEENIIEAEYDEQLKDGSWGSIDEGRVTSSTFRYVVENGEIAQLYEVYDIDGEVTEHELINLS